MKKFEYLLLAMIFVLLAAPARAANHFIVSGGAGSQTGADWSNALPWLPAQPAACGDNYFVAGGTFNWTGTAELQWTLDCNGSGTVNVWKAVDCAITAAPYCGTTNPASVAGWQASYGSSPALNYETLTNLQGSKPSMLTICGGNYNIDGVTPLTGTPTTTGFGFVFRSQDRGKIGIAGTNCPTHNGPITGVTVRHVETDSVNPQYGNTILSCTRNAGGTNVTLGLSHDPAADGWIDGNKINILYTVPTDFQCATSSCGTTIQSMTSSTLVYAQTGTANEVCTAGGIVVLNSINGSGLGAGGASGTALAGTTHITISDDYVHDGGQINCYNCQQFTVERDFLARNHSTAAQHANGMQITCYSGYAVNCGNPVIIDSSIFENIEGSGFIETLPGSSGENDVRIYNNTFRCTDDSVNASTSSDQGPQCGASQVITDNVGYEFMSNAQVYGNTFYNVKGGSTIGLNLLSASSTGCKAHDNLIYGGNGQQFFTCPGVTSTDEDYNITINNTAGYSSHYIGAHDYRIQNQPYPFVGSCLSGGTCNLQLSSDTIVAHLNDGLTLAVPYNVDQTGAARNPLAWTRGAFQFGGSPGPPGVAQTNFYTQTFGTVIVTATSSTPAEGTLILTNSGGGTLTVSSVVASGAGFAIANTCGGTLAPQASCTIPVTFTPSAALCCTSPFSGTVTITTNGGILVVTLSGTGSAPLTLGSGTWGSGTIN